MTPNRFIWLVTLLAIIGVVLLLISGDDSAEHSLWILSVQWSLFIGMTCGRWFEHQLRLAAIQRGHEILNQRAHQSASQRAQEARLN